MPSTSSGSLAGSSYHCVNINELIRVENFRAINFCGFHCLQKYFNNKIFPDVARKQRCFILTHMKHL